MRNFDKSVTKWILKTTAVDLPPNQNLLIEVNFSDAMTIIS